MMNLTQQQELELRLEQLEKEHYQLLDKLKQNKQFQRNLKEDIKKLSNGV
jgi:hypothetical protein